MFGYGISIKEISTCRDRIFCFQGYYTSKHDNEAELDQMREGLKLHGCLAMMEEYPSLMEKLFVPGEDYNVRVFLIMCLIV